MRDNERAIVAVLAILVVLATVTNMFQNVKLREAFQRIEAIEAELGQ